MAYIAGTVVHSQHAWLGMTSLVIFYHQWHMRYDLGNLQQHYQPHINDDHRVPSAPVQAPAVSLCQVLQLQYAGIASTVMQSVTIAEV
jgi:hypothetical protein